MIKIYHEYSFRSKQTPGNLVFFDNLNIRRGYATSDILYYFLAFSDIIVAFRKSITFIFTEFKITLGSLKGYV